MNRNTFTSIIMWAIMALALPLLSACGNTHEPQPEPETPAKEASRTVLVYMVASNNLGTGGYDALDLAEMQQAAREGQLGTGRLLVYHAPSLGAPLLKEVKDDGSIDTLKVYPADAVSVSVTHMRNVLADTKDLAPAPDYGIVLWSHATGWLQDGIAQPDLVQRSYGSDHSKKMNISSLALALEDQDLSFIYFDCCYMGSVEVAYEMRNCAPVMVMSPAEDPVEGMPYQLNVRTFFTPTPDMLAAAKNTFDFYMADYNRFDCPVTMSVIKTDGLEHLAQLTREIYQQAEASKPAGYTPQKYTTSRTCYYYDFGDYVQALATDPALLSDWQKAMDAVVTYKEASPWIWGEVEIKTYSGLSTYIIEKPEDIITKDYNTLQWYTDVASALLQ